MACHICYNPSCDGNCKQSQRPTPINVIPTPCADGEKSYCPDVIDRQITIVNNYKGEDTDLSDYYTKGEVDALIDGVPEPPVTSVNAKTGDVVLGKSDVGLSNVLNVTQASKTEFDSHVADTNIHVTTGEKSNWNSKETPSGAQQKVNTHAADKNNPHEVTKAQVGLSNVDNTADVNKPISTATANALSQKVDKNTTITNSGGIVVGGSLATGSVSLGLDDVYLSNTFLRKDRNDSTVHELSVNTLNSEYIAVDEMEIKDLTLGSITTDKLLVADNSGYIKYIDTPIADVNITVQDKDGVDQFFLGPSSNLQFEGTGDTTVSFNNVTNKITIHSTGGSGGTSGVDSFNSRTGVVVPQSGDYNTSLVTESTNLYFTEPRVLDTKLTGLVVSTSPILASDDILQATGKLQGQLSLKADSNRNLTVSGTGGRVLVSGGAQNLTLDREWTVDLVTTGVTAGDYTKVTVDTYGRVTAGAQLAMSDVSGLVTAIDNKADKNGSNATGNWPINITGKSTNTLQDVMSKGNSTDIKLFLNNPDEIGYPSLGNNKNGSFAIVNTDISYGSSFGVDANSGNTWWQAQRYDRDELYNLILQPAGGYVGIGTTSPTSSLDVRGDISASGRNGFVATGSAGTDRGIIGYTDDKRRWFLSLADASPENGGNTGSDLVIHRYTDSGGYIGSAMTINRSTGITYFNHPTKGKPATAPDEYVTLSQAQGMGGGDDTAISGIDSLFVEDMTEVYERKTWGVYDNNNTLIMKFQIGATSDASPEFGFRCISFGNQPVYVDMVHLDPLTSDKPIDGYTSFDSSQASNLSTFIWSDEGPQPGMGSINHHYMQFSSPASQGAFFLNISATTSTTSGVQSNNATQIKFDANITRKVPGWTVKYLGLESI